MHETLPMNYWHFYWSGGTQYPSCAGLSAKWITTIEIHSVPESDWTLALNGEDIGGLDYDISKTYFEQALAVSLVQIIRLPTPMARELSGKGCRSGFWRDS